MSNQTPREDHTPHHPPAGSAPPVAPMASRRLLTIAMLVLVVFAIIFVATALPRRALSNELRAESVGRDSAPVVQVVLIQRATAGRDLALPGTIQALHEGAIYARVPGYVKRWTADIGSTVHIGQVMAEIDAPELEQNVQQAQAQLAQARAQLGLAKADLERWKSLARDSAVTGQELDQKRAAYDAAAANTGASEANVRRLVQTRQYTHVTAPFTGVVTARNVDIGSLVSSAGGASGTLAAGGAAAAGALFKLAETDTVRTYITVPEGDASSIVVGLEADVAVQGLPNRKFTGRVVRTSRSLDAQSRTLLTEVDIANRDFALLPGMYAQVRLHFPRATPPLLLPSNAIAIRSSGTQVMVVERNADGVTGTVHLRSVVIARDFGASVELASGLSDGQTVVLNPSIDLADGAKVRIAKAN
ncbi:MAG: efflux transporter, family, subunit [Gemmatimonadetes bacterium]|nr:efflux transporter, family, subunit [Gemmatimonadota bacterium]